ncbi:protein CREG1-like [Ctenocephalides felis]|uniref:protein CREG1-like n=1 Tax=Ctenocephalides felis TaxID=7515 RepID=UPI000E6E4721|nr:protein CREG1-like [Ctenocephalides felis]
MHGKQSYQHRISKKQLNSFRGGSPDPVVNRRLAGIARQILRQSTWGGFSTINSSPNFSTGYPFVAPRNFAEGNSTHSTGKPYFYFIPDYPISPDDLLITDVTADTRVSFTVTTEQTGVCRKNGHNVQSTKCYWVVYSGDFRKLDENSEEYKDGYQYLLEKYPDIKEIYKESKLVLGTINLVDVMVIAGKKELECIPLDAYFNTLPNEHFASEIHYKQKVLRNHITKMQ